MFGFGGGGGGGWGGVGGGGGGGGSKNTKLECVYFLNDSDIEDANV